MNVPLLQCQDLSYRENGAILFEGVSFRLEPNQGGVILADPHRCATVLLKICATLMEPTSGEVLIFGRPVSELDEVQLYEIRRHIGLVHRESALVSNMTIIDNVTLGCQYHADMELEEAYALAENILRRLDLFEWRFQRPAALTYEQRRLAIYAREIVKRPRFFLLEHPSLDLGERYYLVIMEILRACQTEGGCGFLVASLKPEAGRRWGDWVLVLDSGKCTHLRAQDFDPARYAAGRRRAAGLPEERSGA